MLKLLVLVGFVAHVQDQPLTDEKRLIMYTKRLTNIALWKAIPYTILVRRICYKGYNEMVYPVMCTTPECVIVADRDGHKLIFDCETTSNVAKEPCVPDRIKRYTSTIFDPISGQMVENVVEKTCCLHDLCNAPFRTALTDGDFEIREGRTTALIEGFIYSLCAVIFVIINLLPHWQYYHAEEKKTVTAADNLENALLVLQRPPPINVIQCESEMKVSGQLSMSEVCCNIVFREDELARLRDLKKRSGSSSSSTSQIERLDGGADKKKRKNITAEPSREMLSEDFELNFMELNLEASVTGHWVGPTDRNIHIKHNCFFDALLEHGPFEYPLSAHLLMDLFDQARCLFENDKMFLHLEPPVVIIGDIRGQYQELHRWFQATMPVVRRKFLFLGGLTDPNVYESYECLAFVAAMKVAYPTQVFLLRGSSEVLLKLPPRFSEQTFKAVTSAGNRMCNYLPLIAEIGSTILCVHSGINHEMRNFSCLDDLKRPLHVEDLTKMHKQILYGQPSGTVKMYRDNLERQTHLFGLNAVGSICRDTGVKLIVRSHSMLNNGHVWISDHRMLSIYSATAPRRDGTVLYADEHYNVVILKMKPQTGNKKIEVAFSTPRK